MLWIKADVEMGGEPDKSDWPNYWAWRKRKRFIRKVFTELAAFLISVTFSYIIALCIGYILIPFISDWWKVCFG